MADEPGKYVRQTRAPGISNVRSLASATVTLCTRGVQRRLNGCSRFKRLYSPRASGVLPLYTVRRAEEETGGWGRLELGRFRCRRRLNLRFLVALLFARQRSGRDDGAGHVV